MQGTVIKAISSNFYVKVDEEVIICTQRGVLKKNKTLPLIGDKVIIDKEKKVIEKILPRKNEILRPNVSNIDNGLIVTSLKHPNLDLNLLDKLLVELEINKIKPIICLTKKDLLTPDEFSKYESIINYYKKIGYQVFYNTDLTLIKKELIGKITVFMGQTGAGKSTLLNNLFKMNLKTGEISLALGRGRHTTRVVEILEIGDIKVLDTPGFSSLSFLNYNLESVKNAFIEFKNYPCLYKDCNHDKESECNLKKAVSNNLVLKSRYENYLNFKKEFERK